MRLPMSLVNVGLSAHTSPKVPVGRDPATAGLVRGSANVPAHAARRADEATAAARTAKAHNPKVAGSNPAPAMKEKPRSGGVFVGQEGRWARAKVPTGFRLLSWCPVGAQAGGPTGRRPDEKLHCTGEAVACLWISQSPSGFVSPAQVQPGSSGCHR